MENQSLSPELLQKIDAYWRPANYLAVGQIYLFDNPLLCLPLMAEHVKPHLLGHWGTTPGQDFIYAHLNRIIKEHDLNMIYLSGPGNSGPAIVANVYLEGAYTETQRIRANAKSGDMKRPVWPMIVLKSPKGWTGPKDESH